MRVVEDSLVRIAERGRVLTLDYAGARAAHAGDSRFGVAVGYRMLQAAGEVLSRRALWDRAGLAVESGHPGAGVRDAVEYVTACVSRGRYRVDAAEPHCAQGMRFAWEVSDGTCVAAVTLVEGFVPSELYALASRVGTPREAPGDADRFAVLKRALEQWLWAESLERLFTVEIREEALRRHA